MLWTVKPSEGLVNPAASGLTPPATYSFQMSPGGNRIASGL